MKPVNNWREGWKWFSIQASAIAAAIPSVWLMLPDDMKASIPNEWVMIATAVVIVLGIIGRFVDQGTGSDV